MTSAKQVSANQSNAQKSTGPKSESGKAASSRNATSHGLSATPETLFAHSPELQAEYRAFEQTLRTDYHPIVPTLEPLFDRWVFASFQARRAQVYETRAEADMNADFGNLELERRWMRFSQMRLRLAREAAVAAKEYHALRMHFENCLVNVRLNEATREADRQYQAIYGPNPILGQSTPKQLERLFARFREALAERNPS
jgi:hypothetical protein